MNEIYNSTVVNLALAAVVAGTSTQTTSVIDNQNFDAITWLAILGSVTDTSVLQLTAYENDVNSTSGGTAVTGGASPSYTASSGSNTTIAVDVIRPKKRFQYATLTRGTANAVVDAILALQYRARNQPVTQPTSMVAGIVSTPEV